MSLFDYIIVLLIFAFTFTGFWLGFIHSIGSLIGVFLGAFIAGQFYDEMATWLSQYIGNPPGANVLGFIVVYIIVNKGVGIIFWAIGKVFHLPILRTFNRLLGAGLGFVEGILAVGIMLYVASRFPFSESLTQAMQNSQITHKLIDISEILAPLLPDILNKLETFL